MDAGARESLQTAMVTATDGIMQPRAAAGVSPGPVPTDTDALFAYLNEKGYEAFSSRESETHPSRGPHATFGRPVRTFFSDERLGHYDVTTLIGEGGRGQVYQATDTKLNRQVALKILPEAFASDPDRLTRFQREAQVLASLNHPNIAQIHGIEETDDTRALVLELVEGPTLADRIAQGPIPLDEALPIAKQIAEALEAAHEQGVIHRDLKPANIKVKDDGTVKVLDFGLAKALDTTTQGDPSLSPTLTAAATQMGVIMGTAAYMSPEQAKGKVVDKRADVWAFGAVLYEMVTGRKAFPGDDVSDTLATVLKFDPNWDALPANLHPRLREALERCLERDVRNRYHDVGDARVDIQRALTDPSEVVVQPIGGARPGAMVVWIAPAAVLAALIAGVAVWTVRPSPAPARLVRFQFTPPPEIPRSVGRLPRVPTTFTAVFPSN